ncbi:Borealin N terminal-domain-containing protein [Annulohypoxylon truncatum]|uniref:Borealin N terminal-domain-containing protein n=1 Tax=Annulohypoxylon truncatum TaxID=327061 RepID=UPI002007ACE3|nr:Borealin N terminal-domain-containing protein [Annulohypoxylon truncatum]KAI1214064.1 Borealin N terminal-domain-containing protein [Annulohypoxylon truncatum]
MAPVKATRKRKSNHSVSPIGDKISMMKHSPHRSPIKRRKLGLTLQQKQAIIDNCRLEVTERARRLRAQYNVQAQQLRSRVEMRVNRIPTALRKMKMGELLAKSLQPQQPPRPPKPTKSTYVAPPVPPKDGKLPQPVTRKPVPAREAAVGRKRLSTEISSDKENRSNAVENPKKRLRGVPAKEPVPIQPANILSPTSSNTNTRAVPRQRPASPTKPMISRPASPTKGPPPKAPSNLLSGMADKVRGTRPAAGARKATNTSTTSSNNGPATTRTRQAAAVSRPPTAASTRGRRKASAASETSNGSATTVVKKTTASRAAKTTAPPAKRTVMSTIKSATTKKPPASKATTAPTGTGTGRTLRKRA